MFCLDCILKLREERKGVYVLGTEFIPRASTRPFMGSKSFDWHHGLLPSIWPTSCLLHCLPRCRTFPALHLVLAFILDTSAGSLLNDCESIFLRFLMYTINWCVSYVTLKNLKSACLVEEMEPTSLAGMKGSWAKCSVKASGNGGDQLYSKTGLLISSQSSLRHVQHV